MVRTPNLDALAQNGVRFSRHYSQAAPCGPGRASLYTGLYQAQHRVVGNGTPLDRRFDNIAWAARRAGYRPTLFGYTDQAIDPRDVTDPADPRLSSYEGVLPGFEVGLDLPSETPTAWLDDLKCKGHGELSAHDALASEDRRPASDSMAAFVTDRLTGWIAEQPAPWFAHLSHLRPHPPFCAAGEFAGRYDPQSVPDPIAPSPDRHPLHVGLSRPGLMGAPDAAEQRRMAAQYFGMISEVDHQLGRLWQSLKDNGSWDDTFILVTSDHGEQLGDHGLMQKGGFFEASYHVPLVIRDPRQMASAGRVVEAFTENVDVAPTLCVAMGLEGSDQANGRSLMPFISGTQPKTWRTAAHWEYDWRTSHIGKPVVAEDRRGETQNLAVLRRDDAAYVQFGDGSFLAFDLASDPTWRTPLTEPGAILELAQEMLVWRSRHADRTLTGFLTRDGGVGRAPATLS